MPRTVLNVNRNTIASNRKHGRSEPVVRLQQGSKVTYGHSVEILDSRGESVGRLVYTPDKPLSCGAQVYVVCDHGAHVSEENI